MLGRYTSVRVNVIQGFGRLPSIDAVTTLDVAVVGGGVIGAACARALALRKVQVGVFEPGPLEGAASPASAGMLAAQVEAADDDWLTLAAAARDYFPDLAAELRETTGQDIGLRRDGIAAVAFESARAAELETLAARQRAAGLRAEWLRPTDFHRRCPGTAPNCLGALLAPDDGAVDPPALRRALLAHAEALGARVFDADVERILSIEGRVTGVRTRRHQVMARHVVLAGGAWSSGIGGLPRPVPVVPVRGQLVSVQWPKGVPAAVLYHDHGYVLPRRHTAILGSTMEHVGFDATTTTVGREQILAGARRLLPQLDATAARDWAGLRPVTPDGLPLVGADPEIEGFWYATGHGRNGILLSAMTGEVIADLITAGTTNVDISLFRPNRFAVSPKALSPRP